MISFMKKIAFYILILNFLTSSCIRSEYTIEDINLHTEFELGYALPVVKGEFNLADLVNNKEDGLFQISNDTIFLKARQYPVFSIERQDLLSFQKKDSSYTFNLNRDISFNQNDTYKPSGTLWTASYNLVSEEDENMEIDSLFFNSGFLWFTSHNNYDHNIELLVRSGSLIDNGGSPYQTEITIPAQSNTEWSIDLQQFKIIPESSTNGITSILFDFAPVFHNSGTNIIRSDQEISVNITSDNLNDIEYAFGNATNKEFGLAIPLNWFNDSLYNKFLTGSLAIADPRINVIYDHSLGCESSLHFRFESYPKNGAPIKVTPPDHWVNYSFDYLNPSSTGNWQINKSTAPGIDKIISFFDLDSIYLDLSLTTNPNKNTNREFNYLLDTSRFDLGLEFSLPLKLLADVHFSDTIANPLLGEELEQKVTLEHFRIYYSFENKFPLGFDASIELYDSIQGKVIETILFNENDGVPFLQAAEVENENVIAPIATKGSIAITENSVNNFLNHATHMIVKANFFTSNHTYCRIGISNGIKFKLGFDLKGAYELDPDFSL